MSQIDTSTLLSYCHDIIEDTHKRQEKIVKFAIFPWYIFSIVSIIASNHQDIIILNKIRFDNNYFLNLLILISPINILLSYYYMGIQFQKYKYVEEASKIISNSFKDFHSNVYTNFYDFNPVISYHTILVNTSLFVIPSYFLYGYGFYQIKSEEYNSIFLVSMGIILFLLTIGLFFYCKKILNFESSHNEWKFIKEKDSNRDINTPGKVQKNHNQVGANQRLTHPADVPEIAEERQVKAEFGSSESGAAHGDILRHAIGSRKVLIEHIALKPHTADEDEKELLVSKLADDADILLSEAQGMASDMKKDIGEISSSLKEARRFHREIDARLDRGAEK